MAQLFFGADGSPLSKPEDVIRFLGKQEKHWNKERSAYQVAHCWFLAMGLPSSICRILATDSAFKNPVLDKAVFEKKTRLDSFGRESQSDVLALVSTDTGRLVLGVEAKVDESFGPRIQDWNDYSPGKLRRLAGLLDRLRLRSASIASLRYQLLHRTVAALIEAEELGVTNAAMIVQSFDEGRAGFADFVAFSIALGTPVSDPGQLSPPRQLGDVIVRLGWTENRRQLCES